MGRGAEGGTGVHRCGLAPAAARVAGTTRRRGGTTSRSTCERQHARSDGAVANRTAMPSAWIPPAPAELRSPRRGGRSAVASPAGRPRRSRARLPPLQVERLTPPADLGEAATPIEHAPSCGPEHPLGLRRRQTHDLARAAPATIPLDPMVVGQCVGPGAFVWPTGTRRVANCGAALGALGSTPGRSGDERTTVSRSRIFGEQCRSASLTKALDSCRRAATRASCGTCPAPRSVQDDAQLQRCGAGSSSTVNGKRMA